MRNYGNGVENRCGGGSRKAFGGDFMGLILIIGMEKQKVIDEGYSPLTI